MRLLSDKSFLGIGTSNPQATLHLYFQDGSLFPTVSQKLLQLTTPTSPNGFSIISDYNTKDITFKQQESAKFFIEGVGGGFMIAPSGKIGFGTDAPERMVHVVGNLLIDRTASMPSSLQFRHSNSNTSYDILSDVSGLKFITTETDGLFSIQKQSMIISSSGNVGFGTTDPKQKVHLYEGNLLITSVNSGTANYPTGALLFADIIDEFYPNGKWSIEYLNSANPTYGGQGLNFRRHYGKNAPTQVPSVLFLADNGRIGIGNKVPMAKLDVDGSFMAQSANINGNIVITSILSPTNELEKSAIVFDYEAGIHPFPPPGKWGIEHVGTGKECGLNFWKYGYYAPAKDGEDTRGMEYRSVMFFDNSDNVGIGTESPKAKLEVAGSFQAQDASISDKLTTNKIRVENMLSAKEIKVELTNPWPDFVFNKDYNLLPLQELEQFVNKNQHLPNVPTATSVAENGINVGEMNAILLQKMEEMTLYILQQNKKLTDLQNQIDELKKQ